MLVALVVVLLVALVATAGVAIVARRRAADRLARADARIAQLEQDLTEALRPPPASSPAERAVARVVRTASRATQQVRRGGLTGLLQGSVEELVGWASERRNEIVTMAAPDGTVTVMFTDIENSTTINERIGDDAWVRVLAGHDAVLNHRVEVYRGQVVKSAGDGIMAAFRDAEAACRAAVEIQRDLRRSIDPRLRVGAQVRVRIGIHTGTVIARDGDYFGTNVAIAARVSALATGGEVLVSSAVREALDEDASVRLVPMGEVALKGLPGSYEVWRVTTR